VAVTLTKAGEAALKARPRGVPVTVESVATTPSGRRATNLKVTRLQTSSRVTLRLSGHDQPAARGTSAVARTADRRVVITIEREPAAQL
jgi:hypothetical protein